MHDNYMGAVERAERTPLIVAADKKDSQGAGYDPFEHVLGAGQGPGRL